MAEDMTVAALAAEVAQLRELYEARDKRDEKIERQVEDMLARRAAAHEEVSQRLWGQAKEYGREAAAQTRRGQLRVIPGSAKRRTKRRGQLRLVS